MTQRTQLSLRFDEHTELLTKVKEHCAANGLSLTSFVASAMERELKSSEELINGRFDELHQRVTNLEGDIADLKKLVRQPKPSSKPKARTSTEPEVRAITYLKSYRILSQNIKPTDTDIDKIFEGNDGSKWKYLGVQPSKSTGLPSKLFQRL